ncbi:MAG: glutaredoxin domain-containing protein [Bdellovibrionia bacterium]
MTSTSSPQVKVYTMSNCPFCVRAKKLLTDRGIPFQEILVPEEDDAQWESLFKLSGLRTMPQIFAGDRLIGGFSHLADLDKSDGLKSLR